MKPKKNTASPLSWILSAVGKVLPPPLQPRIAARPHPLLLWASHKDKKGTYYVKTAVVTARIWPLQSKNKRHHRYPLF